MGGRKERRKGGKGTGASEKKEQENAETRKRPKEEGVCGMDQVPEKGADNNKLYLHTTLSSIRPVQVNRK